MSFQCQGCKDWVRDDTTLTHPYICHYSPFDYQPTEESETIKADIDADKAKLARICNIETSEYVFANIPDNDTPRNFLCYECEDFQEHMSGHCLPGLHLALFQQEAKKLIFQIMWSTKRYIRLIARNHLDKVVELRESALRVDPDMTQEIAAQYDKPNYMQEENGLAYHYMKLSMKTADAYRARWNRIVTDEESDLEEMLDRGTRQISQANRMFLLEKYNMVV